MTFLLLSNSHYRTGATVDLRRRPSQPTFGSRYRKASRVKFFCSYARRYGVLKFGYLAMLLFTVAGSFWLEAVLKVGVLRRFKRALLSIFPSALVFLAWDSYAISNGHWRFDANQIIGIYGPSNIPLEEFLFFLIVPLAALMTIEAVRTVKKHWIVGDEK